uniref:Uncharacterized protein n=1 Tax=Canis lupus dingo TaxID=286419 RepID=A0A8C0JI12_CANLU
MGGALLPRHRHLRISAPIPTPRRTAGWKNKGKASAAEQAALTGKTNSTMRISLLYHNFRCGLSLHGGGPGLQEPLPLGELDISSDEFILDEVDVHIQAHLEDELVKEALKTGVDLRHYSKQVELELQQIEQKSIRDYIQEIYQSLIPSKEILR